MVAICPYRRCGHHIAEAENGYNVMRLDGIGSTSTLGMSAGSKAKLGVYRSQDSEIFKISILHVS